MPLIITRHRKYYYDKETVYQSLKTYIRSYKPVIWIEWFDAVQIAKSILSTHDYLCVHWERQFIELRLDINLTQISNHETHLKMYSEVVNFGELRNDYGWDTHDAMLENADMADEFLNGFYIYLKNGKRKSHRT